VEGVEAGRTAHSTGWWWGQAGRGGVRIGSEASWKGRGGACVSGGQLRGLRNVYRVARLLQLAVCATSVSACACLAASLADLLLSPPSPHSPTLSHNAAGSKPCYSLRPCIQCCTLGGQGVCPLLAGVCLLIAMPNRCSHPPPSHPSLQQTLLQLVVMHPLLHTGRPRCLLSRRGLK
jgi:hypothetical protein